MFDKKSKIHRLLKKVNEEKEISEILTLELISENVSKAKNISELKEALKPLFESLKKDKKHKKG